MPFTNLNRIRREEELLAVSARRGALWRRLSRASPTEAAPLYEYVSSLAVQVAHDPVLDRDSQAGWKRCSFWAAAAAAGAVVLGVLVFVVADVGDGLLGLLAQAGTALCLAACVMAWLAAYRYKHAPGLPSGLTAQRVDDAADELRQLGEMGRPLGGPGRQTVAQAMLTLDVGLLLALALPVLMPTSTPLMAMLLSAGAAMLLGKLLSEAVERLAFQMRIGALRQRVARAAAAGDTALVSHLRAAYDVAEGGQWPLGQGASHVLTCYRGAWVWGFVLAGILGGLLLLRLLAGGTGEMGALVLLGAIALGGVVLVAADRTRTMSLTSHIDEQRRIVDCVESGAELNVRRAAETAFVEGRLIDLEAHLVRTLQPMRVGEQARAAPDLLNRFRSELKCFSQQQHRGTFAPLAEPGWPASRTAEPTFIGHQSAAAATQDRRH